MADNVVGIGADMAWQQTGPDTWRLGVSVRGLVRYPRGEVYFNEELTGPEGGWVWFAWTGSRQVRGVEAKLEYAVEKVEEALGVKS